MRVSHGTYVRSLLNDLAEKRGSCATTVGLSRTAVGHFTLADAVGCGELRAAWHDPESWQEQKFFLPVLYDFALARNKCY